MKILLYRLATRLSKQVAEHLSPNETTLFLDRNYEVKWNGRTLFDRVWEIDGAISAWFSAPTLSRSPTELRCGYVISGQPDIIVKQYK